MKEINITVPEGYEIDKENSTFDCIKFKKRIQVNTWTDLPKVPGVYIESNSTIVSLSEAVHDINTIPRNRNIFASKKYAKSALAMAQISQLLPYYGGEITKEEWNDADLPKYVIFRMKNHYETGLIYNTYDLLAFHTKEQGDRFLSFPENVQLVKDYLMID